MTPTPPVVYVVSDICEFEYENIVGVYSTEAKAEDYKSRREAARPQHYDGDHRWLEVHQYTVDEDIDFQ